jgi:tetraacyldisaccharide 4'-kinase
LQTQKYRLLLLPFSYLYGAIAALRNRLFNKGVKKSFKFDFPVISVGNLSTGGTGKTPHIEFLISLLKQKYTVGVVSRGYGRKTKGFFVVDETSAAADVGDEPLQIKLNHPQANVAVGEQRILAIPSLLNEAPQTQIILLDDAYQHRYVTPGLNILLTDYNRMFYNDFVLPAGNLREFRAGYKRADIIIVSKCPAALSTAQKLSIKQKINPAPHQQVFFTGLMYGLPYRFGNTEETISTADKNILFFAGIANTMPLQTYLTKNAKGHDIMGLTDHYKYTAANLPPIIQRYNQWGATEKILLTTQKDAVKLMQPELKEIVKDWPLYVLPIEISMDVEEKQQFAGLIETYIQKELSYINN